MVEVLQENITCSSREGGVLPPPGAPHLRLVPTPKERSLIEFKAILQTWERFGRDEQGKPFYLIYLATIPPQDREDLKRSFIDTFGELKVNEALRVINQETENGDGEIDSNFIFQLLTIPNPLPKPPGVY